MTHGEEPGPETHKDSAVLTYLEGLLMHPVVAGPGATVGGRSEAAHSNQQQVEKGGRPPIHGPTAPAAGTNGPSLGASQHLKKARLLRSGAWNDSSSQRISSPSVEINGQGGGVQNGILEGSPHAGESTLLASLLQSFSSRLQSVAMSQNPNKPSGEASTPKAPTEKEPLPVYGTASSRLKGLMRKNKLQNHSNTPYSRRGHSQDRPPESPRSAHSATPPTESCAERLKAVANMVKIRSSPSPSPKPSVACSQLALLLSSEAHLQQYSREHALKAQLSGRSASERLAAMANQQHGQDTRPPSVGGTLPGASDTLSSLTTLNSMSTSTTTLPRSGLSSPQSPSLLRSNSQCSPPPHPYSHTPREKKAFDSRPTRPPQTCSSLLLLLLNNHNNQKQLTKNGHVEDTCGILPPSGPSSVTSDSECSTQERSLAKDSSDAESSYSSCSPIDLSVRSRVSVHDVSSKINILPTSQSCSTPPLSVVSSTPAPFSPQPSAQSSTALSPTSAAIATMNTSSSLSFSTSSLDKLTESLINKWKPEPSCSIVSKSKEAEMSPDLKSHPKLTLMQLLLERRNNEVANKSVSNEDLPLDISMATMSRSQSKSLEPWDENETKSPPSRPVPPAHPLYPLSREQSGGVSPYSYPSPHVQSSPLDLCKSKAFPVEKSEPGFSASKLLQNLAQCGSSSPPIAPIKSVGPELDNRPLALLERLNAPVHRTTTTPLSEGPSGTSTPFSLKEATPPAPSQIENLLERRTVLQLLLGTSSAASTPSRKDRPSGSAHRNVEVSGGHTEKTSSASSNCDSSNGSISNVKVKTEHVEEKRQLSGPPDELSSRKRLNYEKNSSLSDYHPDLKTEPRPAEVIAKYGLLSQLLKQQTATYYTSAAVQVEPQLRQVKEEQRDYHSPSPKKRRLCSELTDTLNNGNSPRTGDHCSVGFATPGGQESLDHQRTPKEEASQKSPPNETLSKESRGFNVLKQLLLSDNCLKELSPQSRGALSPSVMQANGKANGSIHSQSAHNVLNLPGWHPHGHVSSGPPGHLRALSTPPTSDGLNRTQWGRQPTSWPVSQKRDTPTLVKKEPESPSRWSGPEKEEEDCDSNPDSPRLSRSNPILYYMLQKGSLQLRKEIKDQAASTPPVVRVKEEPISDMHAYEPSSHPQSPSCNDKHSHKSRGLSQSSE